MIMRNLGGGDEKRKRGKGKGERKRKGGKEKGKEEGYLYI